MKNTSFKFASENIHPGESLTLALPLPQVFSCAPLYMPIKLIHGRQKGPTLLLIAAMYGNELNGTEIIQRLLNIAAVSRLKGTLIAIPVMNVHGLINRSRFMPDGIDLNRHFPGHQYGTNAERLANIFVNEILQRAEYCINLQTGPANYYHYPTINYYAEDTESIEMAKVFQAPVISKTSFDPGSLQEVALQQQKVFLNYVAGEAMRFDLRAIRIGLNGILNIMRKLEMIPAKNKVTKSFVPLLIEDLKWVTANGSGTHHTRMKIGQKVRKDDLLSVIKDPFGSNATIDLRSPYAGVIVGKNNTPLIHEGDNLFQVALCAEHDCGEQFIEYDHHLSEISL